MGNLSYIKKTKIYIAGSNKVIYSGFLRVFAGSESELVNSAIGCEPNLKDQNEVEQFFQKNIPAYVFLSGGKSGGINANKKFPAELMIDNLLIESNVIKTAHKYGVKKLFYLASSCCYPKHCSQPMQVESLLSGPLEPSNESYAVAKLAGIKLCQAYNQQYGDNFIIGIPANIFGPGDDFSLEDSHVIAALMKKMHVAKERSLNTVKIWGTGKPQREFIFIDDLVNACIFVLENYDSNVPINLGSGICFSIAELAEQIKEIVGFNGKLVFDKTKPDGMPVKILDSSKLKTLGWKPLWSFNDALKETYSWFKKQEENKL